MSARAFHSVLHPIGPHAAAIAQLWWLMFGTATVVFVATLVFFGIAVFRGRRRREPIDGSPRSLTTAVSSAVGLTVVILFGLLVASMWTHRVVIASPGGAPAITIEVIGHQWWWEVEYEDQEPVRRVVVANEIHMPVGRSVVMKVTSRDVIHSFWAPNIQGKRDLIPGYTTAVWLRADTPGVYRGQCAEFCGRQHAHMAFSIVVEPEATFEAWRQAQLQPAAEPGDGPARRGRDVFMSTRCAGCHTIRGTDAAGQVAPDLTHLAQRGTIAAGLLQNTKEHLAQWIENPQAFKPGNQMPPNALPSEDLEALVAYLETLK